MNYKHLDEKTTAEIAEALKRGDSFRTIMSKYHIHHSTLMGVQKLFQIPLRKSQRNMIGGRDLRQEDIELLQMIEDKPKKVEKKPEKKEKSDWIWEEVAKQRKHTKNIWGGVTGSDMSTESESG